LGLVAENEALAPNEQTQTNSPDNKTLHFMMKVRQNNTYHRDYTTRYNIYQINERLWIFPTLNPPEIPMATSLLSGNLWCLGICVVFDCLRSISFRSSPLKNRSMGSELPWIFFIRKNPESFIDLVCGYV
jgi:hypothetical protein